jgi:hypothetical protein
MTEAGVTKARATRVSWTAMTLSFISIGLIVSLTLAFCCFGSIPSAVAYLQGDRLIANRYLQSFGEVEQGQHAVVTFELTNASSREITILGARTLCTCVFAEDLPLSIPPRIRRTISVAIKTDSREGPIQQPVYLFTDLPAQPEIELRVRGHILSPGGQPGKSNSR